MEVGPCSNLRSPTGSLTPEVHVSVATPGVRGVQYLVGARQKEVGHSCSVARDLYANESR